MLASPPAFAAVAPPQENATAAAMAPAIAATAIAAHRLVFIGRLTRRSG